MDEKLSISLKITNTSDRDGAEVVQCYLRDKVSSTTRPVKELIDFRKTHLKAQESKNLEFIIGVDQLAFFSKNNTWEAEPGSFDVYIGTDSNAQQAITFELSF